MCQGIQRELIQQNPVKIKSVQKTFQQVFHSAIFQFINCYSYELHRIQTSKLISHVEKTPIFS